MKADWIDYPLSAVFTAVGSTTGGLFTFFLSLSIGSWAGLFAGEVVGICPCTPSQWMWFSFAFVDPIFRFCRSPWGILYVVCLMCIAYAMVFHDWSRFRTAGLLIFAQFVLTTTTENNQNGCGDWDEYETLVCSFLLLFALPGLIAVCRTIWRMCIGDAAPDTDQPLPPTAD